MAAKASRTVRMLVDYAAPVAFLGALFATKFNYQAASWVLVGASALALIVGFVTERRVAPVPLFAGTCALVFGGLTLYFHDPKFVKMKLTFVDSALAAGLLGGVIAGRNPLKSLLGEALQLPDRAWRVLTIRYALFFIACAVANEFVWRTQDDKTWGVFRLCLMGATLLFSLAQTPFFIKHGAFVEAPKPADPPDAAV